MCTLITEQAQWSKLFLTRFSEWRILEGGRQTQGGASSAYSLLQAGMLGNGQNLAAANTQSTVVPGVLSGVANNVGNWWSQWNKTSGNTTTSNDPWGDAMKQYNVY